MSDLHVRRVPVGTEWASYERDGTQVIGFDPCVPPARAEQILITEHRIPAPRARQLVATMDRQNAATDPPSP